MDNQQVLDFVVRYMRIYILDSAFISGLQLFNKSLASVLGSSVQKDFEARTRNLWELYEMQQQLQINAELINDMGLLTFEEENPALLNNILAALNHSDRSLSMPADSLEQREEELNEQSLEFLQKFNIYRLQFEMALVNTTAMQEFLLNILINGTAEKKRQYTPLLSIEQYSSLVASSNLELARLTLFNSGRRIIELKKRMLETFEKLQSLMKEGGDVNTT